MELLQKGEGYDEEGRTCELVGIYALLCLGFLLVEPDTIVYYHGVMPRAQKDCRLKVTV